MDAEIVKQELEAAAHDGAVLERLKRSRGIPKEVSQHFIRLYDGRGLAHHVPVFSGPDTFDHPFGRLKDTDRDALIATLLPHVAPSANAGWDLLARRPYAPLRKPFRAAHCKETLAQIRLDWLTNITAVLGSYERDIEWVAERAAHIGYWLEADLGWLLAGALELGGETGDNVLEILKQSAAGEHPIGEMGRHVTQAMMSCSREEAWEYIEKMLLAAQRQEGLRDAILQSAHQSHPEAFRRLLRLIREERLARFSSVVRAIDWWFGFKWDGSAKMKLDDVVDTVLRFFDHPDERHAALDEKDAQTAYLALWTLAFDDVESAIPAAVTLLDSGSAEIRFVATHFLVQARWTGALPHLTDKGLADSDLRVAGRALDAFGNYFGYGRDVVSAWKATRWVDGELLTARLEELLKRLDSRVVQLEALVWPWWEQKLERGQVALAMVEHVGFRSMTRLVPYLPDLDPSLRASILAELCGVPSRWDPRVKPSRKPLSAESRQVALDFLGDPSPDVRWVAFQALEGQPLETDEVERLVELLHRKAGDLRNGCIKRLGSLDDGRLVNLIEKLLADRSAGRRTAGLELLRHAVDDGRASERLHGVAARYRDERDKLSEAEHAHLEAVLEPDVGPASTDDALGLIDPARLRTWPEPKAEGFRLHTPAARGSLDSLAQLVLEHQKYEVRREGRDDTTFAALGFWLPGPRLAAEIEELESKLPLADTWKSWLLERAESLRDPDGMELLRALLAEEGSPPWSGPHTRQLTGQDEYSQPSHTLQTLLEWAVYWQHPPGAAAFLLDGLESRLAAIRKEDFEKLATEPDWSWYSIKYMAKRPDYESALRAWNADAWLRRVRWWRDVTPTDWSEEDAERLFGLLRWFQNRSRGGNALQIRPHDLLDVWRTGRIDEGEIIDTLVGRWTHQPRLDLLAGISGRRTKGELAKHPRLVELVDRCRRRIVEVESQRGDRESAATHLALELRWSGGLETVTRAVEKLGKTSFARTGVYWSDPRSRQHTLSRLVLRSTPREEDQPEDFAAWVKRARINEKRLVELAVYAPQWAGFVNHVLEWPGLESAVWWIQAHTKDDRSWGLPELQELWTAQVSERTPLSAADLKEGAVDVRWFREAHAQLGAERWAMVHAAAKYASSSAGHRRAQLFAAAMLGETRQEELVAAIETKRHQDSVRALGLLPLADGAAGRAELLERYHVLQEFRRGSRKFGSQRKASEGRATDIGQANLARTAGYADPLRLQWAMEREAVKDLIDGPVTLVTGETRLVLSIDADGKPDLTVEKKGKTLKSIPQAIRKDPAVVELKERVTALRRQASRVRDSLEGCMCRGDTFSGRELRELLEHPVLAPGLSRLVFVADDFAGYPAKAGKALRDAAGAFHAVGVRESLRLAHPHDLLEMGDWSGWQRECFQAERVQPFKQLFRELYLLTEDERGRTSTRRYAGHQVAPRQALALLGSRGWVSHPEEGVQKTFHQEGLTARLDFQETWFTPAEIEGLTLEEACFTQKNEWKPLPLSEIPPQVFSEAMRDLDLVVSVAHQGGVDPEASASTIEMRAALLRETSALLELKNVDVKESHAFIDGELGRYSVHLGSAVTRVLPGSALVIVAVHSQHRGRLFLPFADDDPRTAEVLSKVLLLARDKEIKDPNILDQIRAARR